VPWSLAFLGGSLVASWLARRLSAAAVLVWGLVAAALGFGGVTLAIGDHALAVLVGATVLMSLGMAPAITIGNEMMITAAPPERAGAASALAETCAEFSGAFGVALFGSFGMALYRASLSGSMPAGLGPDAAAMALATLGGAVAVARDAPPVLGAMLLDAARSSFTDAMRLNAAVAAAILLAAAGVAACILRRPAEAGRMQPPGRASSGGHRRRPARRAAPAERAGSRETP